LAFFRELLGTGGVELLGFQLFDRTVAAQFFVQPAGAFMMLGLIIGTINTVRIKKERIKQAEMDAKIKAALAKKAAKQKALEEQKAKEAQKEAQVKPILKEAV
jgi:electron transport complex protein RnfE